MMNDDDYSYHGNVTVMPCDKIWIVVVRGTVKYLKARSEKYP
jgi:hypothetical protein